MEFRPKAGGGQLACRHLLRSAGPAPDSPDRTENRADGAISGSADQFARSKYAADNGRPLRPDPNRGSERYAPALNRKRTAPGRRTKAQPEDRGRPATPRALV